jgi:hypothetical protein
MKRLMMVTLVIAMASVANASFVITVNGVVPDGPVILPSDGHVDIGIWGDGDYWVPLGGFYLGISAGDPASLNIDNAVILSPGEIGNISLYDNSYIAEWCRINNPFVGIWPHFPYEVPSGSRMLVDQIDFYTPIQYPCDITVALIDGEDAPYAGMEAAYDTQVLRTPEPATVALLGLGGLAILRKRRI